MEREPLVSKWALARFGKEGRPDEVIFRYAEELNPNFERSQQPDQMILVWRYQSENGKPSSAELERMSFLEDALAAVFETDRFATLALVATGGGLREWTYYARSEEEFFVRLNQALGGHAPFPIEIYGNADPTWSTYEEFMVKVRQKMKRNWI